MEPIQWIVLIGCALFFLFSLLALAGAIKLRGRGRSSSIAAPAPSILGETLRQRMEREDREKAEQVVDALYTTGLYIEHQADRDKRLKNLAGSLGSMFGGPPAPNA